MRFGHLLWQEAAAATLGLQQQLPVRKLAHQLVSSVIFLTAFDGFLLILLGVSTSTDLHPQP